MTYYEPEYAWAAAWSNVRPRPFILVHTVRDTRKDSIQAVLEYWRREGLTDQQNWKRAYRAGLRIIRVQVAPAFGVHP